MILKKAKRILAFGLALTTVASAFPFLSAGAAPVLRTGSTRYAADSYGSTGQTKKGAKNCGKLFTYSGAMISALNVGVEEITVTPQADADHPGAGGTYTAYCMNHQLYGAGDNGTPEYSVTLHGPRDPEVTGASDESIKRVEAHKDRLIAAAKLGYDGTDSDWNHKEAFKSFYGQSGKSNLSSIYAYGATKMAIWSILFDWDPSKVGLQSGIDSRVLDAYQYIMNASKNDTTATASDLTIKAEPIDGGEWKTEGEYKTLAFAVTFVDQTALNRIDTGGDDTGKVYLTNTSKLLSVLSGAVFTQYDNLNSVLNDGDKITRKDEQYRFKVRVPKDTDLSKVDVTAVVAEAHADWDERKMASMLFGLPSNKKYQPYLTFGGTAYSHTPIKLRQVSSPPVPPDVNPPGPSGKTGSVIIRKVDKADKTKGLAGATFSIQSIAANYSANGVTGADGCYTWNALPFATKDVSFTYTDEDGNEQTAVQTVQLPTEYVVTEISPPDGYRLPEGAAARWQFTLDPEHPSGQEYTFEDEILLGDLEIRKADARDGGKMLAGAAFTITHLESGKSFSGTTGSGGTLEFKDIPTGVYTIHEDAPPEGYVSSGADQSVVVTGKTGNTPTSITITNGSMARLKIRKVDKDTGNPLAGAAFHVTRTDGETVGDYTTGADGYAELTGLVPGSYTVTETKAPSGYVLDAPQQNVVLNEGDEKTITFQDSVKPQIVVKKISAKGAEPLPGAVVRLSTPNGQPLRQYTTDENGQAVITGLTPGSYVITEVTPPNGYLKNEQKYTVEIKAGDAGAEAAVVTITDQEIPGFLLRKVDAVTGKPLAGAKFEISKPDVPGSAKQYVTNDQGTIFIKEGTISDTNAYVVREIQAPQGYILNETPTTVRLEPDKLKTLVWKNEQKPGLHILKTDAQTGAPLNGAVIRVSRAGGDEIGTYTTGAGDGAMAGEISIPNLEPGVYQLEEITAPNGYDLDPQRQTVTLQAGRVAEVSFTDTAKPGLQILKTDETTKQPLAGARFSLKTADDRLVGEFVTDSQGRIFKGGLTPGIYKVRELEAPKGYLRDDTVKTVTLTAGQTSYVTFTNKPMPELQILKVDEYDGSPLGGAVFRVTRADGSTVGEYTTDTDGRILIPRLEPGVYTIEETKAPQDYLRDEEKKNVTLEWGKATQVIFRNRAKPEMSILKTDELSGSPLAGAVFQVRIKNGKSLGSFTSDENGLVELGKLEPGLYVISEIKAPNGYSVTNLPQEIQLGWGDKKTVAVRDKALSPLYIKKTDAKTHNPVAGARFRVAHMNGEPVGEYVTDSSGFISIPRMEPGWYVVTEIEAPDGYQIDNVPKNVEVRAGLPAVVEFTDAPHGNLSLKKLDKDTGRPLAGARFRVETIGGSLIGEYESDENGDASIPKVEPGSYKVSEIAAPDGYLIDSPAQTVELKSGVTTVLTFTDSKIVGLTIKKIDAETKRPLAGAKFTITKPNGDRLGDYVSDENGLVTIEKLEPGDYVVTEIQAPDGYVIDKSSRNVTMTTGTPAVLTFTNRAKKAIQIQKIDEKGSPLAGADFRITKQSGEFVANVTTDQSGTATIPRAEPGWYVITETKAPAGYLIDSTPKTIELKTGAPAVVTFTNVTIKGLTIRKVDSRTRRALAGAVFTITKPNGERLGEYTSDENGLVHLERIEPGDYTITEMKAPDGYLIDTASKNITVRAGESASITFTDTAVTGLTIQKVDAETRGPLSGAVFRIAKADGTPVGEYTTDENGLIIIEKLEPGDYLVTEIKAPDGYVIDDSGKPVTMKPGEPASLTFTNRAKAGLLIQKTDGGGNPLAGASFEVKTQAGEFVGEYTTDASGLISVPELAPGWYVVTETRAPDGYLIDSTPKTAEVKTGAPAKLTFTNGKITGIQIIKTAAQSGKPLKNVTFRIERQNGEFVGEFRTGADGMIYAGGLEPGWYAVQEIRAPSGYEVDSTPRNVEVKADAVTTVIYEDAKLGGIRIHKIDADTGRGLQGARFLVKDEDRHIVAEIETDQDGCAELDDNIPDGKYYLEEIEAPDGYTLDPSVKTIHIKNGRTEEIEWENSRTRGQIQILKTSAEDNAVTGLPAGSRLEGAIFEITRADTGQVVAHITTDYRGVAASGPLPIGRYKIREVGAPAYYALNTTVFEAALKVPDDVVRIEVRDASARLGTSVKKSGNGTVTPGARMRYDFSEIANTSNTPLDSFYWHDQLPTDAVRLEAIHTGTWNQPGLAYRVTYKTNLSGDYRTLADGLLATQGYDLDCTAQRLGLQSGEYVTDFRFEFGTVRAGFREVTRPMILVRVLPGLSGGYRFSNRTDTAGKYLDKWISASYAWVTVIQGTAPVVYPKTGY